MKNLLLMFLMSCVFSFPTVISWQQGLYGYAVFFVSGYILIAYGISYEENKLTENK